MTTDVDQGKARARWDAALPRDGRIALTLRHLDARSSAVQIRVGGGWLLLDTGRFGFYSSEAQWAETGWRTMPLQLAKRRLADPWQLELVLAGDTVLARLDGVALGRWSVVDIPDFGVLEVEVSAPRGSRSRLAISAWSVPHH